MARSSTKSSALVSPRRRRFAGIERLEGRCFLSAAPLPAPLHVSQIHVAPLEVSPPMLVLDAGRAEHPVQEIVKLPASPVYLPAALSPGSRGTPALFEDLLSRAPASVQWNEPATDHMSGRIPPLIESSFARIVESDLSALEESHGQTAIRFFIWTPDSGGLGFAAGPANFASDDHLRLVQLARESLLGAGMVASLPDGARAPADHSTHDIDTLKTSRTATPSTPAGMGQNVESERGLELGRLNLSDRSPSLVDSGAFADSTPEAVSHLVAFSGQALRQPASKPSSEESPLAVAAEPVKHDLLLPRFMCDAAALRAALADFVSEAEELGVSLMSILADMSTEGEAALVTGLLGAATAYRYAREGRRRERADEQEVLRARFIDAPISIRLRRKASA